MFLFSLDFSVSLCVSMCVGSLYIYTVHACMCVGSISGSAASRLVLSLDADMPKVKNFLSLLNEAGLEVEFSQEISQANRSGTVRSMMHRYIDKLALHHHHRCLSSVRPSNPPR